jgi:hypothetical protein
MLRTGIIHQDAADHLGGDGVEAGAIAPLDVLLVHQAHEGLVDQRSALQGVVAALAAQVGGSQPAKLPINERHQLFEGGLIALARVGQELRYVGFGSWDHMEPFSHYHPAPEIFVSRFFPRLRVVQTEEEKLCGINLSWL